MGLDAPWRCLGSCYPRHRLQSFWRLEISIALNFVVRLYGLDGIVRHSPILAARRIPRIALDYIWRPCLHLRNRVLHGEASSIQPLDLAPLRERGNSLSFLRRPLVCRVGRESRTPSCPVPEITYILPEVSWLFFKARTSAPPAPFFASCLYGRSAVGAKMERDGPREQRRKTANWLRPEGLR
jgi:hypothetical protein